MEISIPKVEESPQGLVPIGPKDRIRIEMQRVDKLKERLEKEKIFLIQRNFTKVDADKAADTEIHSFLDDAKQKDTVCNLIGAKHLFNYKKTIKSMLSSSQNTVCCVC